MIKKNKIVGLVLSDFKIYFVAVATNTVWYWGKDRHIEQWNRKQNPDPDPYRNWFSYMGVKQFNGERIVFNKWRYWISTCEKREQNQTEQTKNPTPQTPQSDHTQKLI